MRPDWGTQNIAVRTRPPANQIGVFGPMTFVKTAVDFLPNISTIRSAISFGATPRAPRIWKTTNGSGLAFSSSICSFTAIRRSPASAVPTGSAR